jgi:hypothetical protein
VPLTRLTRVPPAISPRSVDGPAHILTRGFLPSGGRPIVDRCHTARGLATAEELALAWTWIHADEALINQGRRYPSGRAAELIGILESMERDVEA